MFASCHPRYSFLLIAAAFLGLANVADAQQKSDLVQLTAWIAPTDPFDPSRKHDAKEKKETSVTARRGQIVTVIVHGKLKDGFHTYPINKKSPKQGEFLSSASVKKSPNFVGLTGIRESESELIDQDGIGKIYEYEHDFWFETDVLVNADAALSKQTFSVSLALSVCDENKCVPVNKTFTFDVNVSDAPPLSVSEDVEARMPPEVLPSTESESASDAIYGPIESKTAGEYKDSLEKIKDNFVRAYVSSAEANDGLFGFLLTAVFFGAITLITPCVFPMIPITVSFFLKQSEKENHNALITATVYCGTIVIVLTIAAVALLGFFRALSINPIMNYFIGGLFIFFALSLFGWYDIQLPSSLSQFTSSREGQGGIVGTVFMALTFTIISFACVAPFLGAFGGMLATGARPWWHIVLAGLAFAITFAAPFFILALFPALLKALPKSGSWLNSVKVVMGFLELAAAFKFFRTAELVSSSTAYLFTYDFVLGIWVGLCLLCGAYLLKIYRLPHDHDSGEATIGVPRLLWAIAFIGLGFYLMPALFKVNAEGKSQRPGGEVYAWVDSFLLPEKSGGGTKEKVSGNLPYTIALASENRQVPGRQKRIFVDFTGFTCTNCRLNEENVFTKPEIKKLLKKYLVVKMYTDKVDAGYYGGGVKVNLTRQRADAMANLAFQKEVFLDETLPLYAILEPRADGKIHILGVRVGRIFDTDDFVSFLKDPKKS